MADKQIKLPGPDHPISIAPNPNRIKVTVGGQVIADTTDALTLLESHYPPVHYIPRKDVRMEELTRSDTTSYCPYKGDASYFGLTSGGENAQDAVWTYEAPYDAVVQIGEHLAFYPDRVDAIEEIKA